MIKLVLLAANKISDNKWQLYAMEMIYQKILRIIKTGIEWEIEQNWRIGYITEVETISDWTLEENCYVSSKERLIGKYDNFLGLLLNKASYPDRIFTGYSGISYNIIRLRQLEILDDGKVINADIWGTRTRYSFTVLDPWWVRYWNAMYSKESVEKYQKYLSAFRRKVFAVVEKKELELSILKLIVL